MKIQVAIAIIQDKAGRFLITQRAEDTSHAGLWEFPGGKLEQNESPESALKREILEEVGLIISEEEFLTQIDHHYEDKHIEFFVYRITQFEGEARCCEQQRALRWVKPTELSSYRFPAANLKFFSLCD